MVGALGEIALERAVSVVEVEIGPAVALAPPDKGTAGEELRVPPLLVRIHPLADDGFRAVCVDADIAEVDLVEVAAEAVHIEALVVAEPLHAIVFLGGVRSRLRGVEEAGVLVFEGVHFHFMLAAGIDVEDMEGALRGGLAGHLIVVGLEGRTRLAHGIDDPELLHRRHVPAENGEMAAVRRPGAIRHRALGRIRHRVASIVVAGPGPFVRAVEGQAALDDERVLGVVRGQAQRGRIHHPEVVVLDIDAAGAVRGDIRPVGILLLLLLVGIGQLLRGDLIGEMVADRTLLRAAERIGLRAGGLDVELEVLVVLELQPLHRDVRRVEGVADDFGELHGQLRHVEDLGFGLLRRIHNEVFRPFGSPPAIPELVGILEPVRADAGRIDHLGNLLLGEALGKTVIGLADVIVLLRGLLRRGRQGQAAHQKGNE